MQKIKIKDRWVGPGQPCFVIVDIGANHNRSFTLAKKLIDKAAEAKADAVKFQIYSARTLYSKNVPRHSYYKKNLWQLIKEIETPRAWIPKLKAYCDKKNIYFFATPFDMKAVDELEPYVDFYKIASFELVDLPLIEYVAKRRKPVIISTGLASMGEIEDAYCTCVKNGNTKLAFLQCASAYPAKPAVMNLRAMETIRKAFDVSVGLSDHTRGIHIAIAAVAMGACFIEKHFTLNRAMEGPDHPFAIEPEELKEMIQHIREVEQSLGHGKKQGPVPEEMENYHIGRRSIHARVKIPKGMVIKEDMLIMKRPGFGIKPKDIKKVIGRAAKCNIEADQWITWEGI